MICITSVERKASMDNSKLLLHVLKMVMKVDRGSRFCDEDTRTKKKPILLSIPLHIMSKGNRATGTETCRRKTEPFVCVF